MREGFYLTPEQRDTVLEICEALNLKTNEEMSMVIRYVAKHLGIVYIRDVEKYLEGKRVL